MDVKRVVDLSGRMKSRGKLGAEWDKLKGELSGLAPESEAHELLTVPFRGEAVEFLLESVVGVIHVPT